MSRYMIMQDTSLNFDDIMSDQSILAQVKNEAAKAKRESAKAEIKKLYGEYTKAKEVLEGIEQKIVEIVSEFGDDDETVKSLLGDE